MTDEEITEVVTLYFKNKYKTINEDVFQSCIERVFMAIRNGEELTPQEIILETRREIVRMQIGGLREFHRIRHLSEQYDEDNEETATTNYWSYTEESIVDEINPLVYNGDTELYRELMTLTFGGVVGEIYELIKRGYSNIEIGSIIGMTNAMVGYNIKNKLMPLIIKSGVLSNDDINALGILNKHGAKK